jgi:hypothetical protein
MDKQTAIRECKRMWGDIEKSGLSKDKFMKTEEGKYWEQKEYYCDCSLCHYAMCCRDKKAKSNPYKIRCSYCPLIEQFGLFCPDLGFIPSEPCWRFWNIVKRLKVHS